LPEHARLNPRWRQTPDIFCPYTKQSKLYAHSPKNQDYQFYTLRVIVAFINTTR
jgi:hypothetical protein